MQLSIDRCYEGITCGEGDGHPGTMNCKHGANLEMVNCITVLAREWMDKNSMEITYVSGGELSDRLDKPWTQLGATHDCVCMSYIKTASRWSLVASKQFGIESFPLQSCNTLPLIWVPLTTAFMVI